MELFSVHGRPFERTDRIHDVDLSRHEVVERLGVATARCIDVAAECVIDDLPDEIVYRATWWVYNGCTLMLDEEVFGDNRCHADDREFDAASILEVIWKDDRFPRWIHVNVESVDGGRTIVRLMFSCCFGKQFDPEHPNHIYPFFVKCPIAPTEDWRWGSPRFQLSDSGRSRSLDFLNPT